MGYESSSRTRRSGSMSTSTGFGQVAVDIGGSGPVACGPSAERATLVEKPPGIGRTQSTTTFVQTGYCKQPEQLDASTRATTSPRPCKVSGRAPRAIQKHRLRVAFKNNAATRALDSRISNGQLQSAIRCAANGWSWWHRNTIIVAAGRPDVLALCLLRGLHRLCVRP